MKFYLILYIMIFVMARRRKYRRRKIFAFKLRKQTVYTIATIVLFAAASFISISFFQPEPLVLGRIQSLTISYFGLLGFLIPFLLVSLGLVFLRFKAPFAKPNVTLGLFLIFLSLLGFSRSGLFGEKLWQNIEFLISPVGAVFLLLGSLIIGLSVLLNTSLDEMLLFLFKIFKTCSNLLNKVFLRGFKIKERKPFSKEEIKLKGQIAPMPSSPKMAGKAPIETGSLQPALLKNPPQENEEVWEYPPLSLLEGSSSKQADRGDINKNAAVIEKTLESFGIQAKVVEVNLGPAVTQYALEIALGTKLSKITALANDLALALAAPTGQIRIEAPIPGRSLVGVEVPNRSLQLVTLRQMLSSSEMTDASPKLSISLGLDVSGKPIITDITRMPHVLVAGTTGSGKSVMINSWISCLLFKTTPQEVRLILIDPKRVELTLYNDIPHLLTPVVVEIEQTLSALKWAQGEMDRRYKLFASQGARNIDSYNEILGYQALPFIVIFVDELADLMAFAPAEVEDSVTRLAQMARATGIHLVISTQRPSVDVLTGLIKANIPARIAFNVSSMVDSRVIIDMPGAEKLLGQGDMLYIPPDQAKPTRVQGTFISEQEVKKLVKFLKTKTKLSGIPIEYTEEVTSQKVTITKPSGLKETVEGFDPYFEEAKRIVIEYDRASASLLQRRLKIGYARAARILDQLEQVRIVGPAEGSKPRDVLSRGPQVVEEI